MYVKSQKQYIVLYSSDITHTDTHTGMHILAQAYTHTHTHAHTHARTHTRTHACTHTCMHARTHTHTVYGDCCSDDNHDNSKGIVNAVHDLSIDFTSATALCLLDRERGNRSQFRITALDHRDYSDDSAYWLKYSSLLSEEKERVWDALLDGLEKYRYAC